MTDQEKKNQSVEAGQWTQAAPYQSQWDDQMKNLMGQINDRPAFQYDVNADALWNQYKDQYLHQGKMAMMDTMGQAAAMTGGYGNSYAQTAGQQMYQGYLQGMNDRLPDFYQMAANRYALEGDQLMNRYGLMADQEDRDYSRWQWQTEWDENVQRYLYENGLGQYAPADSGTSGDTYSYDAAIAQQFVDNMLAGATSSKFDPERIVGGTNALTEAQKAEAMKYLKNQISAGKTK